jgi:hypothetical protein
MSSKEFFDQMSEPNDGGNVASSSSCFCLCYHHLMPCTESVYYFGGVSDHLKEDLLPDDMMFADQRDIDQYYALTH